jgi:hypothetical protein
MLLFPEGRLLSRRWQIVAWAAVLGAALAALAEGFYPGVLLRHGNVENPLGTIGIIGQVLTKYGSLGGSKVLASALLVVSTLVALFSPVVRLAARKLVRRKPEDAEETLASSGERRRP